jgi:hypothetical protein
MRNLVEPPPSTHCELCNGELLLKLIDPGNPIFDTELEIFVCTKCGHHQTCEVTHDRYSAHIASRVPGGNARQESLDGPARARSADGRTRSS